MFNKSFATRQIKRLILPIKKHGVLQIRLVKTPLCFFAKQCTECSSCFLYQSNSKKNRANTGYGIRISIIFHDATQNFANSYKNYATGAILIIDLRVRLISLHVTPWHVYLTIFSVFTDGEFRSLFEELYLVYFVQNSIHHVRLV